MRKGEYIRYINTFNAEFAEERNHMIINVMSIALSSSQALLSRTLWSHANAFHSQHSSSYITTAGAQSVWIHTLKMTKTRKIPKVIHKLIITQRMSRFLIHTNAKLVQPLTMRLVLASMIINVMRIVQLRTQTLHSRIHWSHASAFLSQPSSSYTTITGAQIA